MTSEIAKDSSNPRRHHVEGSPFQPGQKVVVVASVDPPEEAANVCDFVGKTGLVEHLERLRLESDSGTGEEYPGDPMIGVRFEDGEIQEFWYEELRLIR